MMKREARVHRSEFLGPNGIEFQTERVVSRPVPAVLPCARNLIAAACESTSGVKLPLVNWVRPAKGADTYGTGYGRGFAAPGSKPSGGRQ